MQKRISIPVVNLLNTPLYNKSFADPINIQGLSKILERDDTAYKIHTFYSIDNIVHLRKMDQIFDNFEKLI